jgi:hypothetical protein
VDVQGIASRRSAGPTSAGQVVAGHDGAKAIEERSGEPSLHGGQRHPQPVESEHPVVVELWHGSQATFHTAPQAVDTDLEIGVSGWHADPVLEVVRWEGWDTVLDQQEPWAASEVQLGTSNVLCGPPQHDDIHLVDGRHRRFLICFAPVKHLGCPHSGVPAWRRPAAHPAMQRTLSASSV